MLADTIDLTSYPAWLAHVETPQARDAFVFLVGQAATLKHYTCDVRRKGAASDFQLKAADGRTPFAFVAKRRWLLFRFRLAGLGPGGLPAERIRRSFPQARMNRRGEWTARLRDVEDVRVLLKLLALA